MSLGLSINATMRAVAWFGQPYNVSVIDAPVPVILNGTDAVVRITSSAICGSDLHIYHGYGGLPNVPYGLGHEAVGYVAEVGDTVSSLSVGDYVIIPDNAHSGHYGQQHPLAFGVGLPDYGGLQAEYVRVPFADNSLIPIPITNTTDPDVELDYLMVSDVFSTGWHGLTYSGFEPGDTVAVFGAGPVGLLAAYSAILRGASRVYSIDRVEARLDLAKSIGAIPINFSELDPVAEILRREPGGGVTRSLDCVGFESVNATGHVNNGIVIQSIIAATRTWGGVAVVGSYSGGGNSTAGAPNAGQLPAQIPVPVAALGRKGLSLGSGIVLPLERGQPIIDLITEGRASPRFVISAEIGIEEAPEYYSRYGRRLEEKVVIRFPRD